MKSGIRFCGFMLIIYLFSGYNGLAQSGVSIRYIHEYVKTKPKIGIVFSYDSVFLEATIKDLAAKGGMSEAMAVGLAVQTVASRKAFARYEAMTAPAISKINDFNNITLVVQDDQFARGGYQGRIAKMNAMMKKEGIGLIIHVIFGGKFMTAGVGTGSEEKQALFMDGMVAFRFYVNSPSLQPNYLQVPVFNMSYQFGAEPAHKDWTNDQVQAFMAGKNLTGYADMLAKVKYALETDAFYNSRPIGIVRGAIDDKRITVQSSLTAEPQSALLNAVVTVASVYEGGYGGATPASFWGPQAPTGFSEGVVVAQVKGDNKTTPSVEASYQIPIAELVVREGDKAAAICAVRKLPKGFELKNLVGLTVVAREQANWYFTNPGIPTEITALQFDTGKADESFLSSTPALPASFSAPLSTVQGAGGLAWPLPDYAGNALVVPPTTFKEDPTKFAVDKVRSVSETVKGLQGKGFKIGIIFSPYASATGGKGIIRYFSDADVSKLVKNAENILGSSTPGDDKSKLKDLGLWETAVFPVTGKIQNAGQDIVKSLNERYQTSIFELIDARKFPIGPAKAASTSKVVSSLSKVSGGAMDILDLSKTQYKLLGNYELKVDKDKNKIEGQLDLYVTGSVGLAVVGAAFNTSDTRVIFSYSGNTDADYEKYISQQKSAINAKADGMWESKATSAFTFSYKDKEMLHPPTTINSSAKPNIIPKKEKNLLEKVRRYEADGNKIGIVLEPTAIAAMKESPPAGIASPSGMGSPTGAVADTVDCMFSAGKVPFSDQYLYLGQKLQKMLNDAFSTSIFEVIDPAVMPKKMGSKLGGAVPEEVPVGFNTQYKTIVTLSIAGTYSIKRAGTSGITLSKPGGSASPGSKDGKYEMNLGITSTLAAEEFNNENSKDKNVARNMFVFASDKFVTNDCPASIDDFVAVVGAPEDFFAAFDAMLTDNVDKVIKREMK